MELKLENAGGLVLWTGAGDLVQVPRGKFSAAFLLQSLAAIGVAVLHLE